MIGAFTIFLLAPLYWVVVTSIKPTDDYLRTPPVWFPAHPTTIHYSTALNEMQGWRSLENSLVVATCVMILGVGIGACSGYSIARYNTGGKHLAFWILSQRFLPPIAVVIPIFLLYRNATDWFGVTLFDTRLGLVLLYTVFVLPFTIWMMYAYFRQMPVELEEAALVDGCTRWQALRKVALPLAAPGIVSAAAFAFIFSFTEFLFALVLTSREAVTLPVVVSGMAVAFQGALYGESSALTLVSLIPAFVLGMLVQRHLVRGLTMGAVQG
jgi:multiple sugar transport system permease protein